MAQSGSNNEPNKAVLLLQAITSNKPEEVKTLLAEGVNPNLRCDRKLLDQFNKTVATDSTPLHLAVKYGHCQIVEALLEKGADANAQSELGTTPLHTWSLNNFYASSNPENIKIGKALLNKGADPNITGNGHTPFDNYLSIFCNYTPFPVQQEMIDMLLNKGGDLLLIRNIPHTVRNYLPFGSGHPKAWIAELLTTHKHTHEELPFLFKNASTRMIALLIDHVATEGRSDVLYDIFKHYSRIKQFTEDFNQLNQEMDISNKIVHCLENDSLLDDADKHSLIQKLKLIDPKISLKPVKKYSPVSDKKEEQLPLHHAYMKLLYPLSHHLVTDTELNYPDVYQQFFHEVNVEENKREAENRENFFNALRESNINAKNEGKSMLRFTLSCDARLGDLVFFLLKGANPDARDDQGKRPIDYLYNKAGTLKEGMDCHREILEKGIDYFILPENIARLREWVQADDFLDPLIHDYPLVKDINGNILLHRRIMRKEHAHAHALIESKQMREHVDTQNNAGNTALHLAVLNDDIATADKLLANNAKKNILNKNNQTPMDIAISMKRTDMINKLLERELNDLDINSIKQIFELAAQHNHIAIIEKLIEKHREQLIDARIDSTIIVDLVLRHQSRILSLLFEKNIIPDDFIKKIFIDRILSAFHSAIMYNHLEMIRLLLSKCDPSILHVTFSDGNTLLHYAAEYGHTEVIDMLLKKGADPNAQNNDGYSPVHRAVTNMHAQAVDTLLMRGGDPLQDSTYKIVCLIPFINSTPVDYALEQNSIYTGLSQKQNTLLIFDFLTGIINFIFRAIRLSHHKGEKHLNHLLTKTKLEDLPDTIKKPYPELLKAMVEKAAEQKSGAEILHKIFNNYTNEQLAFLKKDRKCVEKICRCLEESPLDFITMKLPIRERLKLISPHYFKPKNTLFLGKELSKKPASGSPPKRKASNR